MISFIIPAKNASNYLEEAISVFETNMNKDWEVIIVDDHSEDDTYEIADEFSSRWRWLRVVRNKGVGKVQALNFGYELSSGDIIKCIDADDVLVPDFFETLNTYKEYDAYIHDALVVDDNLNRIGTYHMHSAITHNSYERILNNLISIPRWAWTIKRSVAEKVFPMPEDLPFEDVWFSILIKKNANSIYHDSRPLYKYRQHSGQTFGGILNYEKSVLNFRAQRMLRLIKKLKENASVLTTDMSAPLLTKAEIYYSLLIDDFNLSRILRSDLDIIKKIKLILICFFPGFSKGVTRLKWKFDMLITAIR